MANGAAERLWLKVAVGGADECWPFIAKSRTPNGYGVAWADLGDGPRTHTAHRVAFYLANGRAADLSLDVMHSCDNRLCCNPAHLSEGTRLDNMRDCAAKGRTNRKARFKGEAHPKAKITESNVLEFRARHRRGETCLSIAEAFGVSMDLVWRVVARRTWKHVV